MDFPLEVGKRIRFARKKKGFSQELLANQLGKTASAVGQYEIGKSLPSLEVLIKISEICNVGIEWLTKGGNESDYELDSIESKPKDKGAFGSDVEKQLRDKIDEKDRVILEKDRFIMELLKHIDPKQLGKDEVIECTARISEKASGSMTQQQPIAA